GLAGRAEPRRSAQVDQKIDDELAFLDEFLHEGRVHPRRYVPIDRPHVVPRNVFPHVAELDPSPPEDAVILAEEKHPHQTPGLDLESPYPRGEFSRCRGGVQGGIGADRACQGTATPSSTRPTMSSLVRSSASAS